MHKVVEHISEGPRVAWCVQQKVSFAVTVYFKHPHRHVFPGHNSLKTPLVVYDISSIADARPVLEITHAVLHYNYCTREELHWVLVSICNDQRIIKGCRRQPRMNHHESGYGELDFAHSIIDRIWPSISMTLCIRQGPTSLTLSSRLQQCRCT